jgi:PAS domain S-box-containing protein
MRARSGPSTASGRYLTPNFRLLIDSSPLMIWLSDVDNRAVYFNRTWLDYTGRPLSAELGDGWIASVHTGDRERYENAERAGVATRRPFQIEYRLRRNDGAYRWILDQFTPRKDGHGRFAGYFGTCTDISELREATADTNRWQRRFEAALTASGWISYELDLATNRVEWSAGIESLLGHRRVELRDAHGWVSYYVHPEDRDRVREEFSRVAPSGGLRSMRYRVRHREGHYLWLEDRIFFVGDRNTEQSKYIGFVSDVSDRVRDDERLRRSEERFRLATDVANGVVYSHDLDTDVVQCSGKLIEELGFDPNGEPPNRRTWLERVHPDDRERMRDLSFSMRDMVGPIDAQHRMIAKDGRILHVYGRMTYIRDDAGVPHRLIGFMVDVSAMHLAEEALRLSEERFRLAAEAVDGIVYEVDLRSGVIHTSGRLLRRLGYVEMPNDSWKAWLSVVHPDDREGVVNQVTALLDSDRDTAEMEYRVRDSEGIYHHLLDRMLILRDAEGSALRLVGCSLDISKQKEVEAALRASEERFRLAAEAVEGIVYEVEVRDARVTCTGRLLQRLGYGETMALTREAWTELLHPDDRTWATERYERLLRARAGTMEAEYRVRSAQGEYHYLLDRMLIRCNASGGPERVIGCAVDITSQKEAEHQILRLNAELEQRVEERTAALQVAIEELEAFTYSVSHDLRAPLRHVSGFTDLLRARLKDPDPQVQRYLETIAGATARMAEMIDKLLALSRVGRGEMHPSPVDLGELVAEVREELELSLDGRAVEWRVGRLPVVRADRALLRGAVQNLLANAVKFTAGRAPAVIEVAALNGKREHEIVVRDNGAGFDMRYVSKLFGVFQRLHAPGEFEGTGIGLASVRRIINRHGGRVWAQGKPGAGAEFHFTLPAREE